MNRARLVDPGSWNVAGTPTVTMELSEARVRRSVLRILNDTVLCSMATVTSDHRPHINTAYFCFSDELELYFLSHPSSLHCRNLSTNASMAMAIFSSSQAWGGADQGVQLFGTCSEARGPHAIEADQLYGDRFSLYPNWKANLDRDDPARAYRFYRFLPAALQILDEQEFGGEFSCMPPSREAPGRRNSRRSRKAEPPTRCMQPTACSARGG